MPAQGELRGPARHGGGDWDQHASDVNAEAPAIDPELAAFRAKLYDANRRRAQEAVSPAAWALSRRIHGHDDYAG